TVLPGVDLAQWQTWAGAALAGIVLVPVAWWRQKRPAGDRVPGRLIVAVILILLATQILLIPLVSIVVAIFSMATQSPEDLGRLYPVLQALEQFSNLYRSVYIL